MSRRELNELFKEIVKRLVQEFKAESIILHGSYAKGYYVEGSSDLDILVISNFFKGMDFGKRISMASETLSSFDYPLEVVCYTFEEALNEIRRLNLLVLDALEYGIVLHGESTYKKLREELDLLKSKINLRPVKDGWDWS